MAKKQNDVKSTRNLGRGNQTVKPKKNTVASLLAQTRGSDRPDLTIEPVFRKGRESPISWSRSQSRDSNPGRLSSDHESDDGQTSDCDDYQESNGTSKQKGRQVVTDTEDLKVPLRNGWRRETTIREYSKSGIRGEVVYVAPCGKRFKQYPDIIRYLEKRGIANIRRTHFSFSTKLIVGDFLRPTGKSDSTGDEKYDRFTGDQMNDEIDRIRKENGWKPRKRGKAGRRGRGSGSSNGTEASNSAAAAAAADEHVKLLQKLQEEEQRRRMELEQFRLEKEALRILKEAEKRDRAEQLRKERERGIEEKRRKQEELIRQRQEEKMKKLQEIEMKRQQAAILKEQDKERRRQHMLLVKQFDSRKRNEERRKKMEELRVEREKEKERRTETRRMELEILSEMKRPVEDMAVPDPRPLPEIPRVPGLRLCGEAFANLLLVFEFLHNFGETLGFDMESLPTLNSLQSALLNEDTECEEELLSVMTHLVVCAIEDPGVPNPLKQLTILGQNLRQADITNTNISEILRIFLRARAQYEVKLFHGVAPAEPKDRKEAMLGPFVNAEDSYMRLVEENRTYQMSEWMRQKPFLSLNPTQKSEILAFLCNELLNNKAVVNQIEVTVENVHVMKRKKMALDNKVKKLRILHNRKFRYRSDLVQLATGNGSHLGGDSENHSETGDDKDDSLSVISDSTRLSESNLESPARGRAGRGRRGAAAGRRDRKKKEEEPVAEGSGGEEENSDLDISDIDDEGKLDDEDCQLSAEDLQKKIERVTKLARKKTEDLSFVSNTLRAADLGQDRFRRRYWHLAHSGGIFVEGLESGEPWKLANRGMKTGTSWNPSLSASCSSPAAKRIKLENGESFLKTEVEEDNKENKIFASSTPLPHSKMETQEVLRKMCAEISSTPKQETWKSGEAAAAAAATRFSPKVTPNAERLNMFNHSAYFNMSLSPVILNGAVTITPREGNSSFGIAHVDRNQDRPWFNLAAGGQDADSEFHPGKARSSCKDSLPHLSLLERKLQAVKQMNMETDRKPVPSDKCLGWWKLSSEPLVGQIESAIIQKGSREQHLLTQIRKGFDCMTESTRKLDASEVELVGPPPAQQESSNEDRTTQRTEEVVSGAPGPDKEANWSRSVALRVEKYILEQIEALEDKVAAASMQVPGWKVPDRPLVDTLRFRASCLEEGEECDPTALNILEVSRTRLLEMEAAIERRYLKAPLGQSKQASLQTITANAEKSRLEESLDTEDKEGKSLGTEEDSVDDFKKVDADSNKPSPARGEEEQLRLPDAKPDPGDEEDEQEDGGGHCEAEDDDGLQNGETGDRTKTSSANDGIPRGLVTWREAVKGAQNAAQLAMTFYILETSIAWDKSIMKASCQFCHGGENENALLLCDSCDRGYHTYCFKPPITTIPEGDWYCYECVNKATGARHCLVCGSEEEANLLLCNSCPRAYHTSCLTPALAKTPRGKWHCPACSLKSPRKSSKKARTMKNTEDTEEEAADPREVAHETDGSSMDVDEEKTVVTPVSKKKAARTSVKIDKELSICHTLLSELGGHDESWPFLNPVNTKQFPTYKKIIKSPMDISTIRKKLNDGMYKVREEFREDVNLIFKNCQIFNEDDSPVGKAGRLMRTFFESRWAELTSS